MDVQTNPFCAAGMHLPNGSFATFGGNGAISPGGNLGSVLNPGGSSASFDATYQDYDGTAAIRIITPCDGDLTSPQCTWYDSPNGLKMQKHRWYPGCEPLADGSVVLVGGFTNGGYINRNTPNDDPETSHGAAEPTYEFYPSKGDAQVMKFMVHTSGLNAYAHTYLMPSGKMLVQANYSTGKPTFAPRLCHHAHGLLPTQFFGIIPTTSRRLCLTCRTRSSAYTLRLVRLPCSP